MVKFDFDKFFDSVKCWDESVNQQPWFSINLDVAPASYGPPSNSIENRCIDIRGIKVRDYHNVRPIWLVNNGGCVRFYKDIDYDNPGFVIGRPQKEELFDRVVNKSWIRNWKEPVVVICEGIKFPATYSDRYKYRVIEDIKNSKYAKDAEAYWKKFAEDHEYEGAVQVDLRVSKRHPRFSVTLYRTLESMARSSTVMTAATFFAETWAREQLLKPENANVDPVCFIQRMIVETEMQQGNKNSTEKQDGSTGKLNDGEQVDGFCRSLALRPISAAAFDAEDEMAD